MNETTMEPEGLDDPALLAEIEAEFAELTAEIQRISAMPSHVGPRKSELLEALRASWRERLKAKTGDRPEWRQKLDETISRAVDRLLEDGIVENADGSLGFALRGDTIQSEGGPLLRGLLDGLSHMLTEKFPPPTPPGSAQGDAAAGATQNATQANPLQGLLGGLGQVLAGALKSAVAQVGAQVPGGLSKLGDTTVEAKLPTDGGELKVVVKPAAGISAEPVAPGTNVDIGTVDFHGEQKVAASFEFDSRQHTKAEPEDPTATSASPGQAPSGAGPNVFFQQLFAGLGQVMRQALAPQPTTPQAPQPAPPQEAAPASDGAASPQPAPAPPQTAPSPFGGLGQLFFDAIQKAFTPPAQGAGTTPAQSPEPTATASPTGSEPMPTTEPAPATEAPVEVPSTEAMNVRIPQVNAEDKPEGEPAPALNVDIAGLLRQVLGSIKPPS